MERTYKEENDTIGTEDVIVFRESPHILDVVTQRELERSSKDEDAVCKPRFVWTCHVKALSPKRYLMNKENMVKLINNIFNLT